MMQALHERPPGARQLIIRNIVVEHDSFQEGLRVLSNLHRPVVEGHHAVGVIAALLGSTRVGKSFLVKRYAADHPHAVGETGLVMKVLYVSMPIEGSGGPRAILENFAAALGLPVDQRMKNPALILIIMRCLVERGVELLVLDEFDQVFRDNDKRLLGFARNAVRKMADLGTLSIVCVGLPETYSLLRQDAQIVGRGGLPRCMLTPYDWKNVDERKLFRLLCDAFDRQLPFECLSGLGKAAIAERLYVATEGSIGVLKIMLEAAGNAAINDGAPQIDLRHFGEAYEQRKELGTTFNPFVHDPANAPKPQAPRSIKRGGSKTVFSKRREPDLGSL